MACTKIDQLSIKGPDVCSVPNTSWANACLIQIQQLSLSVNFDSVRRLPTNP